MAEIYFWKHLQQNNEYSIFRACLISRFHAFCSRFKTFRAGS